ncbi:MAG: hypothetical protein ACE5K0_12115, partial [Candidatus Methanofastidiosia archaeon]
DKPWPYPEHSSQSLPFYPNINIEKVPEHIGGWGDIIWETGTWCTLEGQQVNNYDKCYKKSSEFKDLAKTYWTLLYSPYGGYQNYPLWLWETMG